MGKLVLDSYTETFEFLNTLYDKHDQTIEEDIDTFILILKKDKDVPRKKSTEIFAKVILPKYTKLICAKIQSNHRKPCNLDPKDSKSAIVDWFDEYELPSNGNDYHREWNPN